MHGSSESTIPWVEKYRPTSMGNIVLEPLNRKIFKNILDKKYFPNLLIYGSPGCGKTTICMNLINEYQKRYSRINKSNVISLNASDERGIDIVRNQIHQFVKSNNLFETGLKFVILDEVDYMTKSAQQALKYILQTSTHNVRFCLICNYITKIDDSLKNEFLCVRFNQLPKEDILVFIKDIVAKEGFKINDDIIYTVLDLYNSDIRSMINYIQLNQNILSCPRMTNVILNNNVISDIHLFITNESNTTDDFLKHIFLMSNEYNIDSRTIMNKYLNYLIFSSENFATSSFLKSIEVILHRHDIPVNVLLKYLIQLVRTEIFR
jgi:replication factor C subunit 3/5